MERLGRHKGAVLALAVALLGGSGLAVVPPLLIRRYLDQLTRGNPSTSTTAALLAFAFIGVSLLVQALAVGEAFLAERLAWTVTNELRLDVTRHCLKLDLSFHTSHVPGEIVERVDGDVGILANFLSRFILTVLGQALLLTGLLVALFVCDRRIGLTLVPFTGLAVVILRRFARRGRRAQLRFRAAAAELTGFLGERLTALEDIAGVGAAPHTRGRLREVIQRVYGAELRAGMWGSIVLWALASFFAWTIAAIALLWTWYLYRTGAATLGDAFLVYSFTQQMMAPLDQMAFQTQDYQAAAACVRRLRDLLEQPVPPEPARPREPEPGPLAVEMREVSFAYQPGEPVLHGVDLTVRPGHSLGVVGRTGSGKSTVARLIAGLYTPAAGRVLLGGVDVARIPSRVLRRRVALVPQEVQVFRATVRDNLTLFDDAVADATLAAVLELLGLSSWFGRLPRGLDTVLGADGYALSAGEEQLLAFARVMLTEPDVVVLDEATSRLDPWTERLVRDATSVLLSGRTAVVITHRLTTLDAVDHVAVVHEGEIVEYGERAALAADGRSRFGALLRVADGSLA